MQTTLNAAQEELVIYLRTQLLLLDDLLAVVREFIEPAMSHSALVKIRNILADNDKDFTGRLFASRTLQPIEDHKFDQLCKTLGSSSG